MNTQRAHAQASPSAGAFVEPGTLAEFNDRLKAHRLPGPLAPREHTLLVQKYDRADLVRALISLHNGARNSSGARAFLEKAISTVRASIANGGSTQSEQAVFVEPKNLGEFNARLMATDLHRALTGAELDALVQQVGRTDLVAALRDVHAHGEALPQAETWLRRVIAEAVVRVARGAGANRPSAESEMPPIADDDHGFHGTDRPPAPRTSPPAAAGTRRAPASERHSAPERAEGSSQRHDRPQARAYGKRAALCVEPSDDGSQGATLMVEMAAAIPNREKSYDWKTGKIRFQLMRKELLCLIAVLYGWASSVEFNNHGESKVKSLSLENQDGGKLYVKLTDKGAPMLVLPVTEVDSQADFTVLALQQACKCFHNWGPAELLLFVRERVAPNMRGKPASR
ncbi:hypothetical protein [Rhodanobacter sp. FW106-PBR-R2A-1-13]|uniref:hypothetical protein n=1 Tax=Rhodanobacter sp. FW106-PBR-R2A-1-13 TaxID=3454845 RepID=UPI0034E57ECC